MNVALPRQSWDLGFASAGAALGKLVDLARDLVRHATMSPEQRELHELFERVAKTTVEPILNAKDAADVGRLVDRALTAPELFAFANRVMRASTVAELTDVPSEPPKELVAVLGAHPAARFVAGFRLWSVATAELVRLAANLSDADRAVAQRATDAHQADPLSILYEPAFPRAMREAMLDNFRVLPSSLVVAYAVATDHPPLEPWLARELAATVERGMRAFVRYVACIPGSAVPESVLPMADRFNHDDLVREQAEAYRQTEEWAGQAAASGADVYDVVSGK